MSEQITPKFEDMTLGQLREIAKHMRVAIPTGSEKNDIIKLLQQRRSNKAVPDIARAGSSLKEGYARIRLDETQNSDKQIPAFFYDNGISYTIPRGVEVDIPIRVLKLIQNSVVDRRRQVDDEHGKPKTTIIKVPQYPHQAIEIRPGPQVKTKREVAAAKKMGPRRRYRALFDRWPSRGELTRAIESGLIKIETGEDVPVSDVMLESNK